MRVVKELILQKSVEPSCLCCRTWKAIQNEPTLTIGITQTQRHHVADQIVRHEISSSHDAPRLHTQLGAALHVLPQNVSGGNLRDAISFGNPLSLRTLARTRRSEQDDGSDVARDYFRHPLPRRLRSFPSHKQQPTTTRYDGRVCVRCAE